ncbi:hypothetical protein SLS58_009887 [Diplodia intermedia]|uniref:Heterokaryon incompatibility domain-containing protein n=1 Tax=Diplodia intermedia TaxID=856260 RepID=A0ABR3T9G3_9PEZI
MPFEFGKLMIESLAGKAQELFEATLERTRGVPAEIESGTCPRCYEFVKHSRGASPKNISQGLSLGEFWNFLLPFVKGIKIDKFADVEKRASEFDCTCCRLILKLLNQCSPSTFPDMRAASLKIRPAIPPVSGMGYANVMVDTRACGKIFFQHENIAEPDWVEFGKTAETDDDKFRITAEHLKRLIARLESLSLRSELDTDSVVEWMQDCETSHPACSATDFFGAQEPFAFTLIDVTEGKLVDSVTSASYIALSYVWGAGQNHDSMFSTLKDNFLSRKRQGALARTDTRLPRVIRDAMDLVERMGQRFLWVDALCIIQDDAENKMDQIARMDAIYSQASMTIVAATGRSAHEPLPGLDHSTRGPISYIGDGPGVKKV